MVLFNKMMRGIWRGSMDRFEVSFRNIYVKVWFITCFPIIFIAIILYFLLPHNYYIIPAALLIIYTVIFTIWKTVHLKRNQMNKQ